MSRRAPMLSRPRPAALTGAAAVVGGLVTVAAGMSPTVHVAYRSVSAHVALETGDAVVATVVAYLAYGRLRRGRDVRDLQLTTAFGLLAAADVGLVLLPTLGVGPALAETAWAPLLVRLAAAGFLARAATRGSRPVTAAQLRATWAVLGLLVAAAAACWAARDLLPPVVDPDQLAVGSGPRLAGHPVVLAGQLVQVVLYAATSVAFTRRAGRGGDPLDGWMGAATALGAFARLNYFLFPTMYTQWVYTGDLLRTGFYLLLLVAAGYEVRTYWAAQAEAAVFAERRRVARDLHDGAVQEIGYVRSIAAPRARAGDEDASRILAAAERALDEMRAALTALSAPLDEPLADSLRRTAAEVADRYDVPVEVRTDGQADEVGHEEREALVRIVREAVSNAVRHGGAGRVCVELCGPAPRRLVVSDDGCGFEPGAASPGGFGLTSMKDRAAALGGNLTVESAPGHGTRVELTW